MKAYMGKMRRYLALFVIALLLLSGCGAKADVSGKAGNEQARNEQQTENRDSENSDEEEQILEEADDGGETETEETGDESESEAEEGEDSSDSKEEETGYGQNSKNDTQKTETENVQKSGKETVDSGKSEGTESKGGGQSGNNTGRDKQSTSGADSEQSGEAENGETDDGNQETDGENQQEIEKVSEELLAKRKEFRPTLEYVGLVISYYYLENVDIGALVETTLESLTPEMSMEDAIKLLVSGIGDPYSAYFTASEFQNLIDSTNGNYCGIGASIQTDEKTGGIKIVGIFSKSPAEKAGMQVGDIILYVDGIDVRGMSLDEAVTYVKGEQGTEVELTVQRGKNTMKIGVVRDTVTIETVRWEMKANNIGYIKILEFETATVEQFDEAVTELEKNGMQGLIIDLRDNPGGSLAAVTDIVDRILPADKLVTYTEDKNGNRQSLYTQSADCVSVPMVVLINKNSASASELFTGAMKDYGVAKVVGETSFGKGIVQGFLEFTNGGALKLTVSKYYTPNGICIHGTGITPDYKVALTEGGEDTQLNKAMELLCP